MIDIERVAENLFDKIRSRFPEIRIGDDKAKSTVDPTKARIFNFDFSEHFDNITISLIDENNLKIYYDMEAPRLLDPAEKAQWYKFLKNMRFFAQRNGLTYDVRDIAKDGLDQHDLKHINKDAEVFGKDEVNMTESRLYGTKRSSYQKIGEVRIIVRHSKPIVDEDPRARGQNIMALYIENSLGERFRLPEGTTLNGARVYARHVKNGGDIHDDFGKHISKIISEMSALKTFVRNMRGREFDDAETSAMVESAINYYGKLHRDLFTIRGQRGYDAYKSLWQPEEQQDEDFDIDALRERFVRRVFDDRLMDALPVVRRAYIADRNKVGQEFEEWANSLLEDPDMKVNTKGPFSNSMIPDDDVVDTPDVDGNTIDGSGTDDFLTNLLNNNGFEYRFQDGCYYFESKEEVERAKDIIAAADPEYPMPKFGVYDYGYGVYGATTFDRELPNNKGVHESTEDIELRLFKKLAGLAK